MIEERFELIKERIGLLVIEEEVESDLFSDFNYTAETTAQV